MRSRIVATMVAVALACVVWGQGLFPPQVHLALKLQYTIGENPFVIVGEPYEQEEGFQIDVACSEEDTCQGLAFIVRTFHEYGEGGIRVTVVDEQGNPVVVDESDWTGNPLVDTEAMIHKALRYNRYFVGLPGGGFSVDGFVQLRAEVIQYFGDDLTDFNGNSNFLADDAFSEVCFEVFAETGVTVNYTCAPKYVRAGSLEGFVPAAAHTPGNFGSMWTTDLWIYRDSATTMDLWYNQEGVAGPAPRVTISLDEDVVFLSDVVATLFEVDGHGSISYFADAPVRLVSRTWTPGADGGTYGQVIPGVPTADAAELIYGRPGETKVLVNQREGFRANLGLVNASGDAMTVQVDILTADGSPAPGESSFTVDLEAWGMTQVNDVLARLELGEREGLVIVAKVMEIGEGALIAYLSEVDNTTNDPSYQEAFQF